MYAYILLFALLSIIIFCIVSIKRGVYSDITWFRVGIGLFSSILFVFIMVQAITFVKHKDDIYTIKKYSLKLQDLEEKIKAKKTLLSFILSKQKDISGIELDTIKNVDDFFSSNPKLKREEMEKVLTEYVEVKNEKDEAERILEERKDRKRLRAARHWAIILPEGIILIKGLNPFRL